MESVNNLEGRFVKTPKQSRDENYFQLNELRISFKNILIFKREK